MTKVKIVSKKSKYIIDKFFIGEDGTYESLMYWVHMALANYTGVFAQFQYSGSTYVVSIDQRQ